MADGVFAGRRPMLVMCYVSLCGVVFTFPSLVLATWFQLCSPRQKLALSPPILPSEESVMLAPYPLGDLTHASSFPPPQGPDTLLLSQLPTHQPTAHPQAILKCEIWFEKWWKRCAILLTLCTLRVPSAPKTSGDGSWPIPWIYAGTCVLLGWHGSISGSIREITGFFSIFQEPQRVEGKKGPGIGPNQA
jgi:hypothetical protein